MIYNCITLDLYAIKITMKRDNDEIQECIQNKKQRCEEIEKILESTSEIQEIKRLRNCIEEMDKKKAEFGSNNVENMPIILEKNKWEDEIKYANNVAKWLVNIDDEAVIFFPIDYNNFDRLSKEIDQIGLNIYKKTNEEEEDLFEIPNCYGYQFECLKASMTLVICGRCHVLFDPKPHDWNVWYDIFEFHLYNDNHEKIQNRITEKYYFIGNGTTTQDKRMFLNYCQKIFDFDFMDIKPEWSGCSPCTQSKTIDVCDDGYLCAIRIKKKKK